MRNGMGIAALVLGILAVIFSLLTGGVGLILAILAIIFGSVGVSRANRGRASNKAASAWGLGLGIASIALLVLVGLVFLAAG